MFWKSCLLGLALSAAAFGASAQSNPARVMISEPVQGYAYYNRPGADLDEHDAEFRDCFVATQVRPSSSVPYQGLAFNLVWGGVIQAGGASAVENCMIARGWRVFQLPEDQGRAFSRLSDEAFTARFAPMVGEATPPGVLARAWANETARPAGYHTPSRPRAPSRDQLSARSFKLRAFQLELRSPEEAGIAAFAGVRGVPLERVQAPGPGNAVVIVRAFGSRVVGFARTPETAGSTTFGLSGSREGVWKAFEVPAGRYRIGRTGWVLHCLGAPAFDIAAGEIVYAGTFDLAGEALGPTLRTADLSGRLDATLVGRVRVAQYENGSTASCPAAGMGIYPLEIRGAPFEPGYSWGSLASPGATTAAD